MADNVTPFTGSKRSEDILRLALKEDFEHVLVVGIYPENKGWWSGGNMTRETTVYYMEHVKKDILDG